MRDKEQDKAMIPSKTFLKEKVLYNMHKQAKIKKCRAIDMPEYSKGGWALQQQKAFKNVCPQILSEMKPIPNINRLDFKEYMRSTNNN